MQIILQILRFIIGGLFIFSGSIKLIDPVGTKIKFEEYFEVFSHDIASVFEWFVPYALPLAVIFCVLEVVLGVALLVKFKPSLTVSVLLAMIVFFTFLTFYSAYFNKVTDCGCFGDFIKLTPWTSFWKDIFLLVGLVFLFVFRKRIRPSSKPLASLSVVLASTLVGLIVAWQAIEHLPSVDFRAYKVGTHIPTAMEPSEPLKFRYIMTNAGGQDETFEKYPTDTTYTFKAMEPMNPEAMPKIKDFSIWNDDGEYTQEILTGNKLLITIENAEKVNSKNISKIRETVQNLENDNSLSLDIMVVTASDLASFEKFRHRYQLALPYYYIDGTVIKTMVRANPGLVLLKDGTVAGKWHSNDTPSAEEIKQLIH